jgi:hypothetical protein
MAAVLHKGISRQGRFAATLPEWIEPVPSAGI